MVGRRNLPNNRKKWGKQREREEGEGERERVGDQKIDKGIDRKIDENTGTGSRDCSMN